MVTVRNAAKERLEAGELALGVGLRQARTVDIAKIMRTAGFDFLFIDLEHGTIPLDTAGQISVAALDAGIAPIVRVPGPAHHHASRALDAGALGIVFPHVDDAEAAARLAGYCRYPRDGTRSIAGGLPQLDFRTIPIAEATGALNQATQVVVMVETGRAIRNVESIAAARGIDVILVGTNDLCLDLGIPGQLDHPDIIQALERVVAACRKHGVHPGLGGIYQPPLMQRCIEMGFRWITTGSDLAFLLQGARQQAEAVRAMYRS